MKARRQIVAALSEDSYGGIATLHDVDRAEQLVNAHRSEVLDEVTAWLVKKAREFRAAGDPVKADVVAVMASKVNRGAVRPDNVRMLPDPGFFEADRTYACGPLRFRCDAIRPHPDGGEPRAIGWIRHGDGGWSIHSYSASEWSEDWTDVTGAGAR